MIIPDPRFYLKTPSATEPTLICFQAKYHGKRVFFSTGFKVHPNEWDFTTQRAKVSKKYQDNSDTNVWLEKIAGEFRSLFRNLVIDGILPEHDFVTKSLQERLNLVAKPSVEEKLTVITFVERFIEESKAQKSINTVKSYAATLVHLKTFAKQVGKRLDFPDITLEWRASFIKYLQGHGVGKNTEGKHIKNVKVFMNEATERGLNTNMDYRSRHFSKPIEDVKKIFLTLDEISRLNALQLKAGLQREIVRDYFVISCMTSLRYSDLVSIKRENIKDGVIRIITQKTRQEVVIPISSMVKGILEKYDFDLPKAPCNQIFNRILKDLGEMAGIDEPVTVYRTIGGVKKQMTYKKYELITCHTGRRSLITNSILNNLPPNKIMMISGHKSHAVFSSYFKASPQTNAESLAKSEFFK